jgi:dTDP-4-amino-4,6-dideoxygalactose transaminase
MTMHKIPLFDLSRSYALLENEISQAWQQILRTQHFTDGTEVTAFEKKFSQLVGCSYAIGVRSGTAALLVALKALGIGPGDEVITTPCTFAATADAICLVGATPVFVDVEPTTGNIDPRNIEAAISLKTKAILVVHLYGVMADMPTILKIAKKYKLKVVEDASHAHGSQLKVTKGKYRSAGAWGDVGCFSLYPSKTLGAAGNAGAITTNITRLAQKIRATAHHGITNHNQKYKHDFPGYNELLDTVQAAVLGIKMPLLSRWIQRKRKIALLYNRAFNKYNVTGMRLDKEVQKPSLYVYSIQVSDRNDTQRFFLEKGIETGIYYPVPLHKQKFYQTNGYQKTVFPTAEKFFAQTISLPLYPELTDNEVKYICHSIEEYCQQSLCGECQ